MRFRTGVQNSPMFKFAALSHKENATNKHRNSNKTGKI
jgi:hypothetical protein